MKTIKEQNRNSFRCLKFIRVTSRLINGAVVGSREVVAAVIPHRKALQIIYSAPHSPLIYFSDAFYWSLNRLRPKYLSFIPLRCYIYIGVARSCFTRVGF